MRTLFLATFLLLLPLSLWAGVGFVHESGFSVTPFSPSTSNSRLVQLDSLGSLGFLRFTESEIQLYDPANDSVLFHHTADSGEMIMSVVTGDFTGNSAVDLAAAFVQDIMTDSTKWRLTCFDGESGLVDSNSITFVSSTFPSPVAATGAACYLSARDLDFDGRAELLFAYTRTVDVSFDVTVSGYTKVYDRFPDSLRWARSYMTVGDYEIEDADHATQSLLLTYYFWHMEFGPDTEHTDWAIELLGDNGSLNQISPACIDTGCDGGGGFNSCAYRPKRIGDISNQYAGEELLCDRSRGFYCPYDGGSSSSIELVLLGLNASSPTGVMHEIWSIPYPAHLIKLANFMIHPNLPGYFFGIAGDTLIMFNGENGSIRTTTTDIPAGQRYWESNWPDSIPRLAVVNGNQVDIYSLDITTAVEDEPPTSLPDQFVLGQPYPNPFNAETTIPFSLPTGGHLRVEIFNLLGQSVVTLADRDFPAGENKLTWEASAHSSGVYLVRAVSLKGSVSRKLMLLK
ncbi:MAG: T9SS type A sorting domain-containing protein [bacterium]|nr:T9SS type A sorting domain-containing protein [bacterium]